MRGIWYEEIPAKLDTTPEGDIWARVAYCPSCYRHCRFCAVYPPVFPALHRPGCTAPPLAPVELRHARLRRGYLIELSGPLHFAAGPLDHHAPGGMSAVQRERA